MQHRPQMKSWLAAAALNKTVIWRSDVASWTAHSLAAAFVAEQGAR